MVNGTVQIEKMIQTEKRISSIKKYSRVVVKITHPWTLVDNIIPSIVIEFAKA